MTTTTIMALLSSQGTACSETALYGADDTPEARARIEAAIVSSQDDAPIPGTWTDCSENEALWLDDADDDDTDWADGFEIHSTGDEA